MKLAYFDCFAGAGGDMVVASLLDAGCDFESLRAMLGRLGVSGYELSAKPVRRGGLAGTKFDVTLAGRGGREHAADEHTDGLQLDAGQGSDPHQAAGHQHFHPDEQDAPPGHAGTASPGQGRRGLAEVLEIIDQAGLPARAADRARRVFERLAAAEAKVHRVDVQQVHFHEVGALDSIVDIVGACAAMELLGIERVICSPVPLGSGMVRCEHGMMPVPAPATAQLWRGLPVRDVKIDGEATTPTAAAIFATLAESFGPLPPMAVEAIGYGAGSRDGGEVPNLLRVFVGELAEDSTADSVMELSANVDDCSGEVLGAAIEALLSAGALDAWAAPVVMKKSRPAWQISALCRPGDADAMERILFEQTTTFGVRRGAWTRSKLERSYQTVETPYGPVRMKVGRRGGKVLTAAPEFEDCRRAAEAHHASVREVMSAAQQAWRGADHGS